MSTNRDGTLLSLRRTGILIPATTWRKPEDTELGEISHFCEVLRGIEFIGAECRWGRQGPVGRGVGTELLLGKTKKFPRRMVATAVQLVNVLSATELCTYNGQNGTFFKKFIYV